MEDKVLRKLFLGFIQIHILHHAKQDAIFGSFMIAELQSHGYDISPGTLYPILHSLEKSGHLSVECKNHNGKLRKYYTITEKGKVTLDMANTKIKELTGEL